MPEDDGRSQVMWGKLCVGSSGIIRSYRPWVHGHVTKEAGRVWQSITK
jgi:hypothetical protein